MHLLGDDCQSKSASRARLGVAALQWETMVICKSNLMLQIQKELLQKICCLLKGNVVTWATENKVNLYDANVSIYNRINFVIITRIKEI